MHKPEDILAVPYLYSSQSNETQTPISEVNCNPEIVEFSLTFYICVCSK